MNDIRTLILFALIDTLLALGIAGVAMLALVLVLFAKRQHDLKKNFLEREMNRINEENERIAALWRAASERGTGLSIDRTFMLPTFFSPIIHIKQVFYRDPDGRASPRESTMGRNN